MRKFSALSTIQLRYLLKSFLKTLHVYVLAIDQIRFINKLSFACVFNVEPHYMPGIHWVAMYKAKNSIELELFCSFGVPSNLYGSQIRQLAKRLGLKIVENPYQVQSNTSLLCGYFCVMFLFYREQGYSFLKTLQKLNTGSISKNETLCRKFFASVNFPRFSYCKSLCYKWCNMNNLDFGSVCIQKNKKCHKF